MDSPAAAAGALICARAARLASAACRLASTRCACSSVNCCCCRCCCAWGAGSDCCCATASGCWCCCCCGVASCCRCSSCVLSCCSRCMGTNCCCGTSWRCGIPCVGARDDGAGAPALEVATGHCTGNGGVSWQVLDPPDLEPPYMTLVRGFTFASDGAIWAVGHPGMIYQPPL